MKKMRWLAVLSILLLAAACGGNSSDDDDDNGNGNGTSASSMETSMDNFVSLDDVAVVVACFTFGASECDCPGGGTVSYCSVAEEFTLDNCTDSDGNVYDGTLTYSDGELNGTGLTVDECTNVTVTEVPLDECGGTITGTCEGESVTCTIVDGTDETCDCQESL